MSTKRDYYEILGVEKTATPTELKSAYRKKALEFHPDRNKSPEAEQKFKEINEAYEVLSNAQKRQTYDQFGHAAFDPRSGFGGGQPGQTYQQGPFTYTYYRGGNNPFAGYDVDFSDPFEIFEQFFGGASPFSRAQRKPHYSVKITFMEAVKGTEKTIIHQGEETTVKIPAGASDGTRIQFKNFDISINVLPHEHFKREGYDIFADHPVNFATATMGGTTQVETVDGVIKIKVRAGTQPNTMIRLKSKGVPHLRGSGRGDHYARLVVQVPKTLNSEQKEWLKRWEKIS